MTSTVIPGDIGSDVDRVLALEALGVSGSEREERFERITRLAQHLFGVSIASVTLIDRNRQWLKSRQGMDDVSVPRDIAFCDYTIRRPETLVVEDLALDHRFARNPLVTGDPHVRFYAGHPLEAPGGQRVGTLCLLDGRPRYFAEPQRALLRELAQWAQQELGRSAELEHAAGIQQALMPATDPVVDGWDFAAMCESSRSVGGDFYDWYRQPDGRLVFTVADVMGKGIGAAIMMATVRSAMRTTGRLRSPAEALREAAIALDVDLQQTSTIVTLLHGRLSPDTGELTWADAGHGLQLLIRADGSVERTAGGGIPLGVLPDERWTEYHTVVRPGDTRVVFSDGLLDLYDGSLAVLDEVVRVVRTGVDAAGVVAHFAAVARRTQLPDDVTLMVMRRRPAP